MFSVIVSNADESQLPGESPRDYVTRLAEVKTRTSAAQARPEHIVIGSDTSVVVDGSILGKPADMADAVRMLRLLRGRTHQVYTGIAVLRMHDKRLLTDVCITDVPMRNYSDEEIDAYVLTGDPLDKAGAYAIQHPRFQPVASMSGCYASVMGLPMCHLVRLLRQLDVQPRDDVPASCQSFLNYSCPVSDAILRGDSIG